MKEKYMLVEVTVFAIYFKGEFVSLDSLSDMYSEAQLRIEVDSPEYEYIKENLDKFSGDKHLKEQYILRPIAENKPIRISGEASLTTYSPMEKVMSLESRNIPWS